MMTAINRPVVAATLLLIILLPAGGCSERRTLAATPNIYHGGAGRSVFDAVPTELRGSHIQVLYATDRLIDDQTSTGPRYGRERTRWLAFGSATVSLTPAVEWDQLVADSTSANRTRIYGFDTAYVREAGRLHSMVALQERTDDRVSISTEAAEQVFAGRAAFQQLISERLKLTEHKDVYVYVHGFANTFDDAVFRCAELWHFLGRRGVAVAYTWPAGLGGLLGYFHDRESGEYTVLHLKQFLRTLAECPDVERVHLIAHSRGTDVTITALRELNIACYASGKETSQVLKLQTLVLASPDLDTEIFRERFLLENLGTAQEHLVIYFSPTDLALGLSNWLFSGKKRLGRLTAADFTPEVRRAVQNMGKIDFVSCDVTGFSTSHDYEFAHPAVLSDMLRVLRDGAPPGAEHGRPLKSPIDGLWQITNDYARPSN